MTFEDVRPFLALAGGFLTAYAVYEGCNLLSSGSLDFPGYLWGKASSRVELIVPVSNPELIESYEPKSSPWWNPFSQVAKIRTVEGV